MKGIIRGFLVFLAAFLLGSAAVIPPAEPSRSISHKTEQIISSISEPVGYGEGWGSSTNFRPEPRPTIEEFKRLVTCRDRTIALVWQEMQRTEEFWDWVNPSYSNTDCGGMYEAYRIDLNGDGVDEIRIRGQYGNHCGATGNCLEFIFQRISGSKYRLLNHYSAERFRLQKSRTNGYRDIYVSTHDSAAASYHYVYRYGRGKYNEAKCWYTEYGHDGSLTRISCAERDRQFEE